jgi:hypothetical protein
MCLPSTEFSVEKHFENVNSDANKTWQEKYPENFNKTA